MLKRFLTLLVLICLIAATPVIAIAAEKSITINVNNKSIVGVNPIIRSGVMYVPYRKFMNALGYKTAFNTANGQISGFINGLELIFWAGDDEVEYDRSIYFLDEPIPIIDGEVFLPLSLLGKITKLSVVYDKQNLTVGMKTYGDGQNEAIKELIIKYYETFSPKLLSSDNLTLGYLRNTYDYGENPEVSEIPVNKFEVTIKQINFTSSVEAKLQVSYVKNTEVLDQQDEYEFTVRLEKGQWKIARSGSISQSMELPKDIDAKAAVIMEKRNKEQNAVLSDLRTYYKAYNTEDLELTVQYTSPLSIESWSGSEGSKKWVEKLGTYFEKSDSRYKLSGERVVFLGEKEAVVHGVIEWSDTYPNVEDNNYKYNALIYMKNVNGHWTYSDDINLDLE